MEEVCFTLRNVGRTFNGKGGVRIERLDIPANCMVAILGDSGCGKTTLLSMLGYLTPAQPLAEIVNGEQPCLQLHVRKQGQLRTVDLLELQQMPAWRRVLYFWRAYRHNADFTQDLGFVFQEAHLLRNATVSVNLAISLVDKQIEQPAATLIEQLANHLESARDIQTAGHLDTHTLPGKLMTRVRELSGGQAQRIALGRAIIRNPAIILADEPTASLDPCRGQLIMALLRHWQQQGDEQNPRTVIWVTHDTHLAAMFADKILILHQGQLAEWIDGRPIKNPGDPQALHQLIAGTHPEEIKLDEKRVDELDTQRREWERRLNDAVNATTKQTRDTSGRSNKVGPDPATASAISPKTDSPKGKYDTPHRLRVTAWSVLSKLALSEVFSARLAGDDTGWLQRILSCVPKDYPKRLQEAGGEQQSTKPTPGMALPDIRRWLIVLAGVAIFVGTLLLPHFVPQVASSPAKQTVLGFGGVLGAFAAVVSAFWQTLFRAFGKWFDLGVFLLLLAVGLATLKGWQVMGDIFTARMSNPELSHVMVQARQNLLRDNILAQVDKQLRQAGFMPPAATSTVRDASPGTSFAWGRYINEVEIDRLKLHDGEAQCQDNPSSNSLRADAIAAHMSEPFVQHLDFRHGALLQQRQAYKPRLLLDGNNHRGVYITRQLALRLKRQMGLDVAKAIMAGEKPGFCLHLMDTHRPVWVAGIIDKLPEDTLGYSYEILLSMPHYRQALRASGKKNTTKRYDVLALYVDPRQVKTFLDHVEQLGQQGIVVKDSRGQRHKLKLKLGDAFAKVRDSLQLADFFNGLVIAALVVMATLAAVMAGIMSYNYIIRNERSLCVMRAFGISTAGIWLLMAFQFALLLIPIMLMVAVYGFLYWPQVVPELAQWSGLQPISLHLSLAEVLASMAIFAVVVLLGSLLATLIWRSQSRWLADRLKEIT